MLKGRTQTVKQANVSKPGKKTGRRLDAPKPAKKTIKPANAPKTISRPKGPQTKGASDRNRVYVRQTDVPGATLEEALRIPAAILDNYGGLGYATPIQVGKALKIDPRGRQLKTLSGAGIAYGLLDGGGQASAMQVTELARRILRPTREGEALEARRESVMRPRVFREFFTRYDGHPWPRADLAVNVVEDMGVPRERVKDVLERLHVTGKSVGFIEVIKDKMHVTLQGTAPALAEVVFGDPDDDVEPVPDYSRPPPREMAAQPAARSQPLSMRPDDPRKRRVFITHGKNKDLVETIKEILGLGDLIPEVADERQSVSMPVPEKVMDHMRACGAAIIHVDVERELADADGHPHVVINPNVLIEIGAAMAFYGKRFILLVRKGITLPSNLQGLYEVRYEGANLDARDALNLLAAIKVLKNFELPEDRLPASTAP